MAESAERAEAAAGRDGCRLLGPRQGLSADPGNASARQRRLIYLAVLLISGAVYLGCSISPPSLMDDVDAVQAQIARNMVSSGDWVTARLDGVAYLEKAPLIY